uniref:Uncharacterized protein n=1 Tax=Trichogramma kaykai TaxID=54128 RepID=A0ABD2WKN5_9HYME
MSSDDESDAHDFKNVDNLHQEQIKNLKSFHKKMNWIYSDKGRYDLLDELYPLIRNWRGQLPNFRDIFGKKKIERLLTWAIKYIKELVWNRTAGEALIEFVARSGYKDEPDVDKNVKPLLLRRTTPLHHAADSLSFQEHTAISELFKIYDGFDVNYISNWGMTHFHVACKYGINDAVEKFLEIGQDINCLVSKTGDSPLHLAAAGDAADERRRPEFG